MSTSAFSRTLLGEELTGPLIIGEVAQTHDGSLGQAHAFVDVIADSGAHAIKFQTHIAHAESSPQEPWRVKFSRQDQSRFEYWERMEFSSAQWAGLIEHAHERGMYFVTSVFSVEAIELMHPLGVDMWKVASGEVASTELLGHLASTQLPVIVSSGMSPWDELATATKALEPCEVAVLQCTSAYPTSPSQVGLNVMEELRAEFGLPVGLSDHSGTIFASLAAASLGADVVEIHVTLHRAMFGPDVIASVTPEELETLCEGARFIGECLANPVDKDAQANELTPMRHLFTKSLFTRRDLAVGHIVGPDDLVEKKPGTGIPAQQRSQVIGCTVRQPIAAHQMLSFDDFEQSIGVSA